MNMYMKEMKEEIGILPSTSLGLAILITVAMVLLIGIMPSVVIG